MFKRVVMIGLFGMSVVAMLPTAAMADFWGGSILWKDIDCNAILTGIKPGTKTDNALVCTVTIEEVCCGCVNPQNKTVPGHASTPQVTVNRSTNDFLQLTTKGKVSGTVVITQSDIEAALKPFTGDICPSKNWSLNNCQPTQIHVDMEIFTGANGVCATGTESTCVLDDSVKLECTIACGAPLGTRYSCICIDDPPGSCKLPGGF